MTSDNPRLRRARSGKGGFFRADRGSAQGVGRRRLPGGGATVFLLGHIRLPRRGPLDHVREIQTSRRVQEREMGNSVFSVFATKAQKITSRRAIASALVLKASVFGPFFS